MIDLSKLDPAVLYEFGRQMWAAFGGNYTTVTFHGAIDRVIVETYEYDATGHLANGVGACEDDLVTAIRKLGVELAAAEENQEESNG